MTTGIAWAITAEADRPQQDDQIEDPRSVDLSTCSSKPVEAALTTKFDRTTDPLAIRAFAVMLSSSTHDYVAPTSAQCMHRPQPPDACKERSGQSKLQHFRSHGADRAGSERNASEPRSSPNGSASPSIRSAAALPSYRISGSAPLSDDLRLDLPASKRPASARLPMHPAHQRDALRSASPSDSQCFAPLSAASPARAPHNEHPLYNSTIGRRTACTCPPA